MLQVIVYVNTTITTKQIQIKSCLRTNKTWIIQQIFEVVYNDFKTGRESSNVIKFDIPGFFGIVDNDYFNVSLFCFGGGGDEARSSCVSWRNYWLNVLLKW